ncbi:MAG: PAS domain S-box protein [Bacteroidota bacterium]|nr:PAS domain S-box protein [Bacteroidota bacterium]
MQAAISDQHLPENFELFHNMVENARDGINITQNGDFKYVNKAFCDMLGYTREEMCCLTASDLLASTDKQRLMEQHFLRMQGIGKYGSDYTTLLHKNGSEVEIEFNVTPITYQGENASFISTRDITERKRMQEKLEQSEYKYRNLVENAHDGIIINQFGKFKFVNPAFCKMLEYSEDELLENDFVNFLAEDDRERLLQYHKLRMEGDRNHMIYEAKGVAKSGRIIHFEINTSFIEYNGHPATFIIMRDHTEQKALEETLKASEKKYRTLIEKSLDGILISQDSKIVMVNKAFADMLEFSVEECLEKFGPECIEPEDRDWIVRYHLERMKGNSTDLTFTLRLIGKSGKRVITECSSTAIQIDGRPASLITSRDITSRIKMQEALEKSERKFRELADLLPQTIFELDLGGNVTYLNKAGKIAFRLSENEIGFQATTGVIPEDHERLLDNIKKAFVEKGRDGGMEYTALRRDGSTFPIVIYSTPMGENNEIKGVRGLIVDISERKAMEEALRKSEEHYRHVIQSLQEGLFVLQDEKFIFVNDAIVDILGYTVEEMTGKHFTAVIPPELRDEAVRRNYRRRSGQTDSWSYEFQLLHKDGKTRIPVILSTNLTELDGKTAVVGTAKDITDRIRAEEEIKAAHKRLEEINRDLEQTIRERTKELTKANTQLLKLQKENLQSQFDVLKQQVNPHFLFNSLNVLISLIRLEPELAEKFTEHLAKVYRYVLENKDNELVNLSTEISFLDAYIFLINIRFMDKVVVNIRIPDDKKNHRVIPLAMQLLIENAIKHNAMSKKSPLVIDIFIDEKNQLNIMNNLQEREAHMTSTGVGLKNIQNRYRLLNNTIPVFEKTETHFIARIPLIIES